MAGGAASWSKSVPTVHAGCIIPTRPRLTKWPRNGRTNAGALRKTNRPSPLVIACWPKCWSGYRPLKKADLLMLAQYTIANLSYNQVPALAKRHKVETTKTTKSPQEVLMKKVSTYDEDALSRLLLELSLLDSAYQRGDVSEDVLTDAAKRYRVDVEKIEKAVAAEFAAKKDKKVKAKAKNRTKVAPHA